MPIRDFLKLEAASGILLIGAMVLALICANTMLAEYYDLFLQTRVAVEIGAMTLGKPLLLWINDGLMAIFFLLVGLEVKREILDGELSSWSKIALPAYAAVGGMLAPALIYIGFNRADEIAMQGWAIPAATDIAFALGILALLGKGVPNNLKLFLLTLAILDDLGAIVIIAIFFTNDLSLLSLGLAAAAILTLVVMNLLGVTRLAAYMLVGAFLWICVLKSGVHATLAGVVLAFAIPLRGEDSYGHSPLRELEHNLHPWVGFAILPVFAFANAGVPLIGMSLTNLLEPLTLGIAAGLFIGKQIGIVGFSWLAVKLRLASLPDGIRWPEFYGMAILCGIGFTMSLFIASLALEGGGDALGTNARLGVLLGSLASSVCGYLFLRVRFKEKVLLTP
ncbi:MAG: Na+/H+ antiporter NhaA [Desulfuromonadales bacterium]